MWNGEFFPIFKEIKDRSILSFIFYKKSLDFSVIE